jgi:hypothetical protein
MVIDATLLGGGVCVGGGFVGGGGVKPDPPPPLQAINIEEQRYERTKMTANLRNMTSPKPKAKKLSYRVIESTTGDTGGFNQRY